MFRPFHTFVAVAVVYLSATGGAFAQELKAELINAPQVEKRITAVRDVVKRLLEEIAKARKTDDIRRINCLIAKLNLGKGLLKASEKAQLTFLEAASADDKETARVYGGKIVTYAENAGEIRKSIPECTGLEWKPGGTTVVYLKPEGFDVGAEDLNPWISTNIVPGAEGYPVVPPATPYR
jgi:hypothetical protein